ncbi:hypothetical protein SAMN05444161_4906 [Rhizobiales bacterium GAS191]|jgi:hypothetical protein|nr:hypothetical protein SAMN05519103_04178 [Rhizobiales bacterium GAS113]SEE12190.1 hypothetical protein SAMN05444161_4906 [Rhizobiales bacterium GAS191]
MKAIMIEPTEHTSGRQGDGDGERRLAVSGRLAARCMSLAAVLAVMATGLQIYDSFEGAGSYWRVLGSAGVALWWIGMAAFFRHQQRR